VVRNQPCDPCHEVVVGHAALGVVAGLAARDHVVQRVSEGAVFAVKSGVNKVAVLVPCPVLPDGTWR